MNMPLRLRARSVATACLCLAATLHAGPALAHASERGLVMLLPTGYYLAGGAVAVAATFAGLFFVPGRWLSRLFGAGISLRVPRPFAQQSVSWAAFAFFAFLVAAGFWGTRDPLMNPLPLTVWTLAWVGLTLLHAVIGNVWAWANPWTGPAAFARRRLHLPEGGIIGLPRWLGHWPATLLIGAFAWFELVDIAPDDPARLAWAALGFWLVNLAGFLVFGAADWRARGEPFGVFFRFVAMLAPVEWRAEGRIRLALPGARTVDAPPPPLTAALFVLVALGSVSFDGFLKTFTWLDLIGVNPLEFPGRSAVVEANTAGLAGIWVLMAAGYFGAVALGARMAGIPLARAGYGALVLSVIPISLAYHFSHYLTVLLVNGQYALLSASDPLGLGWDLLGVGHMHVTTSFLNHMDGARAIWNAQAAAIVIGHVWAVILAHAIAVKLHGQGRAATVSQIPLAVVMIGYTVFGLWLLSTPTGA